MLVVIAVRDMAADFMQQGGPVELALNTPQFSRRQAGAGLREEGSGDPAHALGLRGVCVELVGQPLHAGRAQVGRFFLAVEQVVQHAMAQGTLGGLHLPDAHQLEHRTQHADAAANHGTPVVLHAFELEALCALGLEQAVQQPVQPFARDQALGPAPGHQHVADSTHRARRAVGHVPAAAVEIDGFVQHRLGGHLRRLEGPRGELAVGEILHGPAHAADAVGLHGHRVQALAQDHFGGPAPDVHDQAAFAGLGQQVRHALVDQARFLAPGDHVDGKTQHLVGALQKNIAVAGFAQGLGGDGVHFPLFEAGEALAKPRQAVPAALHGFRREVAILIQAVALAHGFLEVFGTVDLAVIETAYFEAVAVGPKVHGSQAGSILHV